MVAVKSTKYPTGGRPPEEDDLSVITMPRTEDSEDVGDSKKESLFPDDFEDQASFLEWARKAYLLDYHADKHNIDEGQEDLRFIYVDQWDPDTRQEREDLGRPCITINTLPQFIAQVVGDRRINKTQIKIAPDSAGSVKAATVRGGLIKSIENFSRAERIYDQCCEDQVGAGISAFEVTMEYSKNDVFRQDIFIRAMNNPFAVVWDRMSKDITGRDAKRCWVGQDVPREDFEEDYPDCPVQMDFAGISAEDETVWVDQDTVKVMALWRMIERPAMFALMQDGQVEDVTDTPVEAFANRVALDSDDQPYVKEGVRTFAQRWLITGFDVLEGPYELPLSRLPVIKVSGRVGRVGVKQYRFGLIRWARDPSLMRNYWRSIAVETLAMAPRSQWLAPAGSVKGREDDFRDAHLTGDPLLIYNTGKDKPERIDPAAMPAAVLQEVAMNTQDIKDVTGLQDASLGIRSNEVSGKAIMARQREGDVAVIVFHDNLNMSIQEGGVVVNELIPLCYDTIRTVRVVGPDETKEFITVNDPDDEDSPDLTFGKYDVEVVTGPSHTTKRMEAAEAMLEMTKVMPELMAQAADLLVETQDWPGAERIAARFKKIIPIAQQEEAEKAKAEAEASGRAPPQDAQQGMAEAAQQAEVEMAMKMAEAELRIKEAEAQKAELEVRKAEAEAAEAEAKAELALHEAGIASQKGQHELSISEDEVEFNRAERVVDIHKKANPPEPSGGSRSSGGRTRARKGNRK